MTNASGTTKASPASDGFIPADSDNISIFADPVTDNVMHVLVALGAEFWTLRRRMFVLEKVLEKVGVSADDIESYRPSDEDKAAWEQERDVFIARTFAAFTRTGGAGEKQIDTTRD